MTCIGRVPRCGRSAAHDDVAAIISTAGATIVKAGSHYRVPLLREILDTI